MEAEFTKAPPAQILITHTIHKRIKECLVEKRGKKFYQAHIVKYYKIINLIWEESFRTDKKVGDGFTTIHNLTFKHTVNVMCGTRLMVDVIKDDLLEFGIIITDGKYYHGGDNDRPKGYKFVDFYVPVLEDLFRIFYKDTKRPTSRMKASAKHSLHIKNLEKIQIDFKAAGKFIKSGIKNQLSIRDKRGKKRILTTEIAAYWYLQAFNIEIERFWFRDTPVVDRVFSSITGFPSQLRQFLYYEKDKQCSVVDVVNCQPLLINALMHAAGVIDHDFKRICEAGRFYEVMMGAMKTDDRDALKVDIYKNVLFGYDSESDFFKEFKRIFPVTAEFVKIEKEKTEIRELRGEHYDEISGNTQFSIDLQNMEASIILPALREVQEAGILAVSIHDAIFAPSDNIEFIKSILLKHFEKRGLIPDFKY